MSLFPTRSQILGYIFSFSSSKHIGTYWVLDTYLGIEKMKNTLKSVIARVISFSLFTDRFRNIFSNTLETSVSVFSFNFHYCNKVLYSHPLYMWLLLFLVF